MKLVFSVYLFIIGALITLQFWNLTFLFLFATCGEVVIVKYISTLAKLQQTLSVQLIESEDIWKLDKGHLQLLWRAIGAVQMKFCQIVYQPTIIRTLGGTENGTWGAQIKILRSLFKTNTPLKPPFRHFLVNFGHFHGQGYIFLGKCMIFNCNSTYLNDITF